MHSKPWHYMVHACMQESKKGIDQVCSIWLLWVWWLLYDSISKVKASERHLSCLSCQWEGKKQRQQGRQGRQDVVEGWCDSCLNKLIDIQQFLYNHFKDMETWTRKQLNKYFHKVWELILLLEIFKIYLEGFVHYLKTQTRCWSYLK